MARGSDGRFIKVSTYFVLGKVKRYEWESFDIFIDVESPNAERINKAIREKLGTRYYTIVNIVIC